MNTDRQTAVRLHRGTEAAREQVDALLDSLNELDDEALRAVDDAFVLELMNAQEHLEALWRLAVASGARRGELLGVAWLGFSAEQKTMTISQQVLPTRGDLSILPCKTKGSHRTIRLDDETADALERHRKRQLEEREAAGDAYDDHDLIFCDELGGPINPQRLTGWFGDLRKTAGVRPGRLHDVRHSVATTYWPPAFRYTSSPRGSATPRPSSP
jgi:integrase